MKTTNLLENLKFGNKDPHAEPLHVDDNGRAILFSLRPNQSIREHNAPSSPFFVVVIRGRGVFAGGDGIEHTCGPNTLLVFDPGVFFASENEPTLITKMGPPGEIAD